MRDPVMEEMRKKVTTHHAYTQEDSETEYSDNIIKTYDFNDNTNLKSLKGEKVQGVWKLKVSDIAGQDIGKLNKWSLKPVKE